MNFSHPEYLVLLAGVPVVAIVVGWAGWRSRRAVALVAGGAARAEVLTIVTVKAFVSGFLNLLTLSALVVAVSGPSWGEASVEDNRSGLEIVFLFDVSNSMAAEDLNPSRLGRARDLARTVANRFPDAHRAVVVFKGAAVNIVPMTGDSVSFDLALGNVSGALVTSAGTSLEAGVQAALDAFPQGSPRRKVVVMFSDGEALQDDLDDVSEELRSSDIPFVVVPTGTSGGATIPLRDGSVLRDGEGNPVVAVLDRASLERIAALSGGAILSAETSGAVAEIVAYIDDYAGTSRDVVFRRTGVDRYLVFVLLALATSAIRILVRSWRWGGLA